MMSSILCVYIYIYIYIYYIFISIYICYNIINEKTSFHGTYRFFNNNDFARNVLCVLMNGNNDNNFSWYYVHGVMDTSKGEKKQTTGGWCNIYVYS